MLSTRDAAACLFIDMMVETSRPHMALKKAS